MPLCRCGEPIQAARFRAGYRKCLKCGEAAAKLESQEKFKRTAPVGNKMGYQYLGSGDTAKANFRDAGKKNASLGDMDRDYTIDAVPLKRPLPCKPKPVKRNPIGIYWKGGDKYWLYPGVDLTTLGASRITIFKAKAAG